MGSPNQRTPICGLVALIIDFVFLSPSRFVYYAHWQVVQYPKIYAHTHTHTTEIWPNIKALVKIDGYIEVTWVCCHFLCGGLQVDNNIILVIYFKHILSLYNTYEGVLVENGENNIYIQFCNNIFNYEFFLFLTILRN